MTHLNEDRLRSLPAVLVVGDSDDDGGHALTKAAWGKIREQCPRHSRQIVDAAWQSASDAPRHIQPAPQDLLKRLVSFPPQQFSSPLPLPLLDDGHQPESWWREHFLRHLTTFSVWALIAVGRTATTQRLLTAVRPLQIPTLITLSSVTQISNPGPGDDPIHAGQILSLFPSNDTQAQVIAAQVHYLLATSGGERQVYILKETATDPYVTDLAKALETHFKLQRVLAIDALTARDVSDGAVVVCVGYSGVLEQLRESRSQNRNQFSRIIATDGINVDAMRACATEQRDATYYHVSPVVPPAVHAEQAYHAIKAVLRSEYFAPQVDRGSILEPFIQRVRRRLELDYDYYHFSGNRNSRASYTIEIIAPEVDA